MSNNIDRRVVEMGFDNKQFESGVKESVESLDKLKKGLDLEKSAKGLEAIDRAASKIDLSKLADAAQSVADRFSFMGNLIQNVYNRIGDALINATMRMKGFVDSLTLDPIKTGLQEYETQINAIQTILSNTYASMAEKGIKDMPERLALVNDRLDQLNRYADKTIYNFTEMTRNIGTFTAAGVDLDTAVNSIQGIANLAAISGSTSEQASRAMYQLSQAISTGTVRLMDWNSVVNAGMGGEVFQQALIRSADAMNKTVEVTVDEIDKNGKRVKKTVKKTIKELVDEEGFRDSLSKGWLTKDILTATLDQFSWDFEQMAKELGYTKENMEEGIAKAMELKKAELLAGGYTSDQADEIIRLAREANEAATKVKTFTQLFDTLNEAAQSGWTETWRYIIGDFEEAKVFLTSISDFFGEIIGNSAEARNKVVAEWKDLGGRDSMIQSFWNIVHAIQNVINALTTEFRKVFPPKTGQQIFDLTKKFEQFTERIKALTENEEKMAIFRRIIAGIANALDIVRQVIGGIWNVATQVFNTLMPYTGGLFELIAKGADKIVEFNNNLKETGGIKNVVDQVVKFIVSMVNHVKYFVENIVELFSVGPDGVIGAIKNWFKNFTGIGDEISSYFDKNDVLKSIKNFFSNIVDSIANFASNMDGADLSVMIGALFGGGLMLKIYKFVSSLKEIKEKLCKGIKKTSKGISDALGSFEKGDITKSILNIAASLALIAAALFIVSKINPDRLGDAVVTLGIMLAAITAFALVLSRIKMKKAAGLAVTSLGLMMLGGAMLIFASVIERIGKIDDAALVKGIVGLGAVLLELTAFMALTRKAKMGVFKGAGLILLAVSLKFFADVVEKIGRMDDETILRGVVGLGAVLLELGVFLAITRKSKLGLFKGAGLILLATSLNMFANTISKLGSLETNTLVQGIAGLGAVLLELAIFLALTRKAKLGIFKGVGLILLAASLSMFANTIQKIGGMDTDTIIKGIAGLGAVLLELAIFLAITKKAKLGVFKGAALILLAVSLNMFANTIQKIGGMDTDTIVKGVAGLGAVLLELAIFLAITKKAKLGVFKGAALILLAVSLSMFADTISKIGSLDTGSVVKGLAGLGAVLLELAIFLALTKKAKLGVFKGAGLVLTAIAINSFGEAIAKIGSLRTKTIVKGIAGLGLVLLEISAFMKVMSKTKVTGVLSSLVMLGVMILAMQIFAKTLKHVQDIEVTQMMGFSTAFGVALLSLSASMMLISKVPVVAALAGIAKLALVAAAIIALMAIFGAAEQSLNVSSYINSFGDLLYSLGNAIGRFVGGLAQGMFTGFSSIGTELSDFMTNAKPFLDGIKGLDTSAVTGVGNLVSIILQIAGANVISAISSWISGGNAVDNFANDMASLGNAIVAYSTAVSEIKDVDQATINRATAIAKGLVEVTNALPPQGGLAQKLVGAKDLGDFAGDIPAFGNALSAYGTTVSSFSDVSQDSIDKATMVAGGIVDLTNKLPRAGGLAQKLIGAKDIGDFSGDMPALGSALKTYATHISGFGDLDNDAITKSVTIAGGIVDLANKLPRSGGLAQKLVGAKDIGDFSGDMPALGSALKTYVTYISGFGDLDNDAITKAVTIAGGIVDLAKKLPRNGGLAQKLIGAKDIGDFSGDIPALGEALKSYATHISGMATLSADSITKSVTIAGGIVDLANKLPRSGGLAQKLIGAKDIGAFSGDIPALGEALKSYAENIKGFSTVDSDSVTRAQTATEGIVAIAKAMPRSGGLAQKLIGAKDLGAFAGDIPALGEALKKYAEEISGFSSVDETASANALLAAQGIAAIATSLPPQGGLAEYLVGARDLGAFADDIPALGTALRKYAEEISGFSSVDETASTQALLAAQGIAAIATALPAKGGLGEYLVGAKDLGDFSDDIPTFATALKTYATQVSTFPEIDPGKSAFAATAADGIGKLITALPPSGGIVQKITGAKKISGISEDIPGLGESLKQYAMAISGFSSVDQNDITSSINTAVALKGFADTLDETGGWVQKITGQKDLGNFASDCVEIGAALASFASNIGSVSVEETENATKAMTLIKEFTSGLDYSGGIFNDLGKFFGGEQDIVGLSKKMADVGVNLGTFATNLGAADFSNTGQVTQVMTDMQTFVGTLETTGGVWKSIGEWFGGSKDIVGFSAQMSDFGTNFKLFADSIAGAAGVSTDFDSVSTIVRSFGNLSSAIKSGEINGDDMENAGYLLAISFTSTLVETFRGAADGMELSALMLSRTGSTTITNSVSEWELAGNNLANGLSRGITQMASNVRSAAVSAASGAIQAIQITWSIHSPSRVGSDLGMNFDLGIAGGLDEYSRVVSQSAEKVGKDAVDSAKLMLRNADYSVFDYIDSNPTIRPVLDLSSIQNGVNDMSSLFNTNPIIGGGLFQGLRFSRSVADLNFDGAKIAGGMTDKNIVERLDSLQNRISDLGEAISNMQLVLDSGALVGGTSSLMDQALGDISSHKGRAN